MITAIMKDNAKKPKSKSDLQKDNELLRGFLDEQRMALIYLNFDVEATRRERDFYKKKAEGKK